MASNKNAEIEKTIQDLLLCDLGETQSLASFENDYVVFYNCYASSDADETMVTVEPEILEYIEEKLHNFKGMKPILFGYNFWNHTCTLYLYMGCHWIIDEHVHLGVSVYLPYEEPELCDKIFNSVFGCSTPDYFKKLAQKE